MSLIETLLLAIGLSMDAFAVSVASGFALRKFQLRKALRMAFAFGLFQAVMPVIGWAAGRTFQAYVSGVDHWIAFGLLSVIGGKMIYEATQIDCAENTADPFAFLVLLVLAVATSIDALAVGITFAMLGSDIIVPVLIIGTVTFGLSLAGVRIGHVSGHCFEKKIEVAGGLVLIGIGLKILVEHLVRHI